MVEMYSEAEQTMRSGGKYMVSASIKASKFTLKQFDKLCRFIARCLSGKEGLKIGKQSLKDNYLDFQTFQPTFLILLKEM